MNAIPKLPVGPRGPMFDASAPRPVEPDNANPARLVVGPHSAENAEFSDALEPKRQIAPAYAENRFEAAVQRRANGVREPAFVPYTRITGRESLPLEQDVLAPEGGNALVDANPAAVSNVISTGASVAGPIAAAGALIAGTGALWGNGPTNDQGS